MKLFTPYGLDAKTLKIFVLSKKIIPKKSYWKFHESNKRIFTIYPKLGTPNLCKIYEFILAAKTFIALFGFIELTNKGEHNFSKGFKCHTRIGNHYFPS